MIGQCQRYKEYEIYPKKISGLNLKIFERKFFSLLTLCKISEAPKQAKVASGKKLIFLEKLKIIKEIAKSK